eukprot:c25960_g1_i1 orf=223-399(+)
MKVTRQVKHCLHCHTCGHLAKDCTRFTRRGPCQAPQAVQAVSVTSVDVAMDAGLVDGT